MAELRQRVENLAGKFPLYPNLSSDAIEVAWCPICFRSTRISSGATWTRRSHKDRVVRFLLTCDSVGGLVQIPCIERNALANLKDINAARLALHGDGGHKVSLDKETSLSYRSKK